MGSRKSVLKFFSGKNEHYVPITACYHFGQQHLGGDLHANLEIEFYNRYTPDILKVMNDYSFVLPSTVDPERNKEFIRDLAHEKTPIRQYDEQIRALTKIVKTLKEKVVIWDTVFNPWFTVRRHILYKDIDVYMKFHKEELHTLLAYVTDSLIRYIEECHKTGIDGIFYSVPASPYYLSYDDYQEFMKPYDFKIIEAVKDKTALFALHVHGVGNIYYEDIVNEYRFDCFSWSDKNTSLDLKKAKDIIKAPLMGGINEADEFNYRSFRELEKEIEDSLLLMKGHPFILSPGCVLQPQCPTERLQHYFDYSKSRQ